MDEVELVRTSVPRSADELQKHAVIHRGVTAKMHGGGAVLIERGAQGGFKLGVGDGFFRDRNLAVLIERDDNLGGLGRCSGAGFRQGQRHCRGHEARGEHEKNQQQNGTTKIASSLADGQPWYARLIASISETGN